MEKIKKFLTDKKDAKISTIHDELLNMIAAELNKKSAQKSSTSRRDENGDVTEIFCYFHKVWEDVNVHAYGSKKGSTTGKNTMCKRGVRGWTETQKHIKLLDGKLIEEISSGKLDIKNLQLAKAERIVKIKSEMMIKHQ